MWRGNRRRCGWWSCDMSTAFAPFTLLLLPARLRLIRLMSTSLLVVPLSASPILVMGCLEVGAVVLIVAELVEVVTFYLAEVPPRHLHGDATSRDTS